MRYGQSANGSGLARASALSKSEKGRMQAYQITEKGDNVLMNFNRVKEFLKVEKTPLMVSN